MKEVKMKMDNELKKKAEVYDKLHRSIKKKLPEEMSRNDWHLAIRDLSKHELIGIVENIINYLDFKL